MSEKPNKPQYTWWSIVLGITIEGGLLLSGNLAVAHLSRLDSREATFASSVVAVCILILCVIGTICALIWARRLSKSAKPST
jgi:hypothetical protein